MHHNIKDISGQKFGRWTVLKISSKKNPSGTEWICVCECGKQKSISGYALRNGRSKSCGCLQKELVSKRSKVHGLSKTKTYRSWRNMFERCNNPKNKHYENYGGRGIKICERWNDFENFYKDMGEKPEGSEIDRINNNGNYEKQNCKWATCKEQSRNKRNNIIITFNGKTQCITDWAKELNIERLTLRYRIKAGWVLDKALTVPVKKYR